MTKNTSEHLINHIQHGAFTYRIGIIIGLSSGILFLLVGFTLAVLGVSGTIEWVFEASDIKSKLSNAGPGTALALMGMIIIWRFKPVINDELKIDGNSQKTVQEDQVSTETLNRLTKEGWSIEQVADLLDAIEHVNLKRVRNGEISHTHYVGSK